MIDFKTLFIAALMAFDMVFDGQSLETDEGLTTAIWISIYTHRRVDPVGLPTAVAAMLKNTRGGWWGENVDDESQLIGSRMWLLPFYDLDADEAPKRVRGWIIEALQWMTEDGIAKTVDATATIDGAILNYSATITRPDGRTLTATFTSLWESTTHAA